MRFYNTTHQHYCGIDLHAKTMYVCIINAQGETVLHRNMKTDPQLLAKATEPYRNDLVISVECLFTWYWLADWCAKENIPFVLGHALYMRAIHGGKANDAMDGGGRATQEQLPKTTASIRRRLRVCSKPGWSRKLMPILPRCAPREIYSVVVSALPGNAPISLRIFKTPSVNTPNGSALGVQPTAVGCTSRS